MCVGGLALAYGCWDFVNNRLRHCKQMLVVRRHPRIHHRARSSKAAFGVHQLVCCPIADDCISKFAPENCVRMAACLLVARTIRVAAWRWGDLAVGGDAGFDHVVSYIPAKLKKVCVNAGGYLIPFLSVHGACMRTGSRETCTSAVQACECVDTPLVLLG